MSQNNAGAQSLTIKSFLQELATYAALLTPVASIALAWFGVSAENYNQLIYAAALISTGLSWLYIQYNKAKKKIEKDGIVQRPAWLWRFVTNKIPHQKHQLSQSQIMVFVPPGKEAEADKLKERHQHDGNHVLLFHHIPYAQNDIVDEEKGLTAPNGEMRSLEMLATEIEACTALALLDDCCWKKNYPKTLEIVENWSLKHTVRPVISVHLSGRGTLNYSWSHLDELTEMNHSLINSLLFQSANRGTEWYWQAELYRKIVLWTTGLALILFVVSLAVAYSNWNQAKTLETRVVSLEKLSLIRHSVQQEIARSFHLFRTDLIMPYESRFQRLLKDNAAHLKTLLISTSNQSDASEANVIMFAVTKKNKTWKIQEVAATRLPPNDQPFTQEEEMSINGQLQNIEGIVTCAIMSRSFVLWSGEATGLNAKTTNLQGWDMAGNVAGKYDSVNQQMEIGSYRCSYKPRDKENLHKRLLCAPVGLVTTSSEMIPSGAVCISSPNEQIFFEEDWLRRTVLRFGDFLSFDSWEKAIINSAGESTENNSRSDKNPIAENSPNQNTQK